MDQRGVQRGNTREDTEVSVTSSLGLSTDWGGRKSRSNSTGTPRMEFAADAERITGERASSEDRKHTSGGVFVAVDRNLGAVVGD